jgi:hypothetical protein
VTRGFIESRRKEGDELATAALGVPPSQAEQLAGKAPVEQKIRQHIGLGLSLPLGEPRKTSFEQAPMASAEAPRADESRREAAYVLGGMRPLVPLATRAATLPHQRWSALHEVGVCDPCAIAVGAPAIQ